MDKFRGFWRPQSFPGPRSAFSSPSEDLTSSTRTCASCGVESKSIHGSHHQHEQVDNWTAHASNYRVPLPRRCSGTTNSMTCEPPSLLDSPSLQRSRHSERQAQEMITASLSTTPGSAAHQQSKANSRHRGWRWCCKCNFKQNKAAQHERCTEIPRDAAFLHSLSEESLVNVVVEDSPVIDDSLLRQKVYDLRVLDLQINSSTGLPNCQMVEENRQTPLDDEISELEIPGPAYPHLFEHELGPLSARLGNLPKLNTALTVPLRMSTNKARDSRPQIAIMEGVTESLSIVNLDEQVDISLHHGRRDHVEEAIKEAMGTSLVDPGLIRGHPATNVNAQGQRPSQSPRDSFARTRSSTSISDDASDVRSINEPQKPHSAEPLEGSYVDISEVDLLSSSPDYPSAPPPSLDNEEGLRPGSPRLWNYPALDSSATSLQFNFRPTLENIPSTWPEEMGYITELEPDIESEEGRTWRDFPDRVLPMGRTDMEVS